METHHSCPHTLSYVSFIQLFFLLKTFINLFIEFWLCWIFIAAQAFSLVAASGSYSLVAAYSLLIVVAALVAEHRLQAQRLLGS